MEAAKSHNQPLQVLQDLEDGEMKDTATFDLEDVAMEVEVIDFTRRAQWLRAAVLGANDGLLSTASLMMGVGAVRTDPKIMVLTGFAGMFAGAFSMAIGELVSVYSQYDIESSQIDREAQAGKITAVEVKEMKRKLPSPWKAAGASALSFTVGAMVPLVAALFIKDYHLRLGVVVLTVSLALLGFGWLGAVLGKASVVKSSIRVLLGGWVAMAVTFGSTKLIGFSV